VSDRIKEANQAAGPSQWGCRSISQENEPMTAAASRVPYHPQVTVLRQGFNPK
jgi:hypothetical protein